MKKLFISSIIAMAACLFSSSCTAEDLFVNAQVLPQTIQSFLASHFPNTKTALAIKDGNEYEIRMENGWEMEFDNEGQWEKIDCKLDEVPASVITLIPETIVSYIRSNFEKAYITEISRDRSGYDVELSNGFDLEFSSKGIFRKIDD